MSEKKKLVKRKTATFELFDDRSLRIKLFDGNAINMTATAPMDICEVTFESMAETFSKMLTMGVSMKEYYLNYEVEEPEKLPDKNN